MAEYGFKSLCILGRLPAIGLAELESLYGADKLQPLDGATLLDVPAEEINFKRLGGTIKVARVLAIQPTTNWPQLFKFLYDSMPAHIPHLPEGKFTLGLSTYGIDVPVANLNRDLLKLKKLIKADHPVRIVPNKTNELNSAQVLHNQLTHKGGWELLFVKDGQRTILAQTMFVQDIESYAARDQARPKRDARVGMLPPKLAQTIINLAVGQAKKSLELRAKNSESQLSDLSSQIYLLDPFCGTGVILQEAMLMGFDVIGSDLESRMVDYAQTNIDWLRQQSSRELPKAEFEVADATSHKWPTQFDSLASETYLGRAFTGPPSPALLKENMNDVNTILQKFLKNLASQIPKGFRFCLAVPAWMSDGQIVHLPLLDQLTEMGYNRIAFKHVRFDELIYAREGQIVARELVILERV